jgi:hypothetical protein
LVRRRHVWPEGYGHRVGLLFFHGRIQVSPHCLPLSLFFLLIFLSCFFSLFLSRFLASSNRARLAKAIAKALVSTFTADDFAAIVCAKGSYIERRGCNDDADYQCRYNVYVQTEVIGCLKTSLQFRIFCSSFFSLLYSLCTRSLIFSLPDTLRRMTPANKLTFNQNIDNIKFEGSTKPRDGLSTVCLLFASLRRCLFIRGMLFASVSGLFSPPHHNQEVWLSSSHRLCH